MYINNDWNIYLKQLELGLLCNVDDCKQMRSRGSRFCYAHKKEREIASFSLIVEKTDEV